MKDLADEGDASEATQELKGEEPVEEEAKMSSVSRCSSIPPTATTARDIANYPGGPRSVAGAAESRSKSAALPLPQAPLAAGTSGSLAD